MTTSSHDMLARWREDTPGCAHRNHLNNAGAGLMPRVVTEAIHEHIGLESVTGGYEAATAREDQIESTYTSLARLVGASPRNMAIVANATAGFVQSLSTFDFAPGDAIVTSRCDYTSNQIQYLALAERSGVRILHANDLPQGGVDPQSVRELVRRERPTAVAISWIPTNSGLVQDVEGVGLVCEEEGVPYVIDACQAVGQIPIDVKRLRCDYLSATARKFLRGPRGIGFMFASDRALARGDYPLFVDMRGATWSAPDAFELADSARRFEDWEFPYALVLGLEAAARYALDVGVDVAHDRAFALAARLRDGLRGVEDVEVLDRGTNPCAIVTARIGDWNAGDVVTELAARGINATASLRWYGHLDFADKQVESALRLSPHYYNTEAEVDAAVAAVGEIVSRSHLKGSNNSTPHHDRESWKKI